MVGVRTIASRFWNIISKRATRAEQKGETYELTPEQCAELQQEGIQYYHRYLSLFQINDFEGVVRDTQRNLDLFTFVNEHTDREDFSWSLQQFRPYVLMMNTRAKASILLAQGKFADAIAEIERGREAIVDFLQQSNFPELVSKSAEIAFLDEWLEEVKVEAPALEAGDHAARDGNGDREGTLRARCRVARRNQAAQDAKAGVNGWHEPAVFNEAFTDSLGQRSKRGGDLLPP